MTERSERKVGFELEYAGVALAEAAEIVQQLYGGSADLINDAEVEVRDTEFGTFRLELDAKPVKKLVAAVRAPDKLQAVPRLFQQVYTALADDLSQTASKLGALLAPFEIVTPPIPEGDIERLEDLRERLRAAKAEGTKDALHYAFGLHINPEAPSLEVDSMLAHMQAFGLLFPYLRQAHDMDITRRLSFYAEPYPEAYLDHILAPDYKPNLPQLIEDYHRHNRSRNRALDMLPLFAHLDEKLVRSLYGADEKINPRPTYHYRLPNSDIGQGDWSFMNEWGLWLTVEQVAANDQQIRRLEKIRERYRSGLTGNWFDQGDAWAKDIKSALTD